MTMWVEDVERIQIEHVLFEKASTVQWCQRLRGKVKDWQRGALTFVDQYLLPKFKRTAHSPA